MTVELVSPPSPVSGAVFRRHEGAFYVDFLAHAARVLGAERYLEIGTQTGRSLAAVPCDAVSIDPEFKLRFPVAAGKRACLLHQMTSDAYFRRHDPKAALGGTLDLAFLDGMHRFEFLLRDFINVERHMRPNSVVFMHDCLPMTLDMTRRQFVGSTHPDFRGYWTGDVWKVVPILKRLRPDLRVTLLDCPPTGLVMITDLDPTSTVLDKAYSDIVAEFARIPFEEEALEAFYDAHGIEASRPLMAEEELQLLIRP